MEEKKGYMNLTSFLCKAFGNNEKIYNDIDKIYMKKSDEFYRLASKDNLYKCRAIVEGSLLREKYAKKMLGILLYQYEYKEDEIVSDIDSLIEKGFQYTYTYFMNFDEIDLQDFRKKFIKKYGVTKYDVLYDNLVVLVIMAQNKGIKIINCNMFKFMLESRLLNQVEPDEYAKGKMKTLEDMIFHVIGDNRDCESLTLLTNGLLPPDIVQKIDTQISRIFEYEGLCEKSVLKGIKLDDEDITKINFTYFLSNMEKVDVDDAIKHCIYSMYIKSLLKAYKQAKSLYFTDNSETIFANVEELEKKFNKIEEKLKYSESQNKSLIEELELKEKKIKRLEAENKQLKNNEKELKSLREFIFEIDEEKIGLNADEIDLSKLREVKAVIVGGHEKWQSKIKGILPNFIFINVNMLNFDVAILDNADVIFFYVNHLSHALYNKVIEYTKNKNVSIRYLEQHNNINLVLKHILNIINKEKRCFIS